MKLFIVVLLTLAFGFIEGLRLPRQSGRDASADAFFNQQSSYFDSNAHVFKRREITDGIIDDTDENEITETVDTNDHDDDEDSGNNDNDNYDDDNDDYDDGNDYYGDDSDNDGNYDDYEDDDDYGWGSGGSGDHGDKVHFTEISKFNFDQTAIPKEEPKKYETREHVCSEEYGKQCNEVLSSIGNMSDITKKFCIDRENAEECLSNILEHCIDNDEKEMAQQVFETFKEALDSACQGNKESYDSSRHALECIQNNDRLKHSKERCAEFAESGIEQIKNEDDSDLTDEAFNRLSTHLLFECLMKIASEECGSEAAKLLEMSLNSEIGKELEASSSHHVHVKWSTRKTNKKINQFHLYF